MSIVQIAVDIKFFAILVNKNLADEMMLSRTLDELHMQQKQQSRKQRLDDRRGSLASGLFEGRAAFNERRKNSIVNQQLAYDVDNVESTSSSANRRSSIYQVISSSSLSYLRCC